MTKLIDYANQAGVQPSELAALLNLGRDYSDDMELDPWMVDVLDNTHDGVYCE